jgi:hypothetical protein
MTDKPVTVETLHSPIRYTYAELEKACAIAKILGRGRFVLCEAPKP